MTVSPACRGRGVAKDRRMTDQRTVLSLEPGTVFAVADTVSKEPDGTLIWAVKSQYHDPHGRCECILLASGEYAHWPHGDDEVVVAVVDVPAMQMVDQSPLSTTEPRTPEQRERDGRLVRAVWIAWARERPNPKPHHLLPWEDLDEPQREVDRRIGDAFAVERDAQRALFRALVDRTAAESNATLNRLTGVESTARREIARLKTEVAALRDLVACRDHLLSCYRVGGRLTEAYWRRLDTAQAALRAVEERC